MSDIKFKSKVKTQAGLELSTETANRALILDSNNEIVSSTVTDTELGYLSGLSSDVQTQLNDKANKELSNLEPTTAVNSSLQPNTNATLDIGSYGNKWRYIYGTELKSGNNNLIIGTDDAASPRNITVFANNNNGNATPMNGSNNSGSVNITTAETQSTGISGNINLTTGASNNGNSGSIILTTGTPAGSGNRGSVDIDAADLNLNNSKIVSVANPTSAQDAATKAYVDAVAEGLRPKEAVRAATTAAGTLASSFEAGDSIDGVPLVAGDRILIKDQAAPAENGIYIVQATGAPTRATDFDSLSPIDEINGAMVAVQEGSANTGKLFVQTGIVSTIGTDPINFVFFNSVSSLVGGDGITVSGSNISVDHDGEGLQFTANQLALEIDGSTLSKSATGLKVADGGITNTQINASAAIDASKIADGSVSNAEFQYLDGVTSSIQTQLGNKLDLSGGIMSGAIDMGGNNITGSGDILPNANATLDLGSASLNFVDVNTKNVKSSTLVTIQADGGDVDFAASSEVINVWSYNGTVAPTVKYYNATSDFSAGIKAPDALAADYTLTLPANDGDADQVLKTNGSGVLSWTTVSTGASAGDIAETSFAGANNVVAATNVTGFAFANATVRSFKALVSVYVDATTDLYETFELQGIQKGASWDLAISAVGDDSQVVFTITNAGQIQYTSGNYAGFSSMSVKFRAITTSV